MDLFGLQIANQLLNEFKRILKRNGIEFISFANFGWYLKLLIKDGIIKIFHKF